MSEAKHTPGPWAVDRDDGEIWVVGANKEAICMATASDEVRAVDVADANLIAAAPDLRQALRNARERIIGSSPGMKALIAETDAALAKAEGRT